MRRSSGSFSILPLHQILPESFLFRVSLSTIKSIVKIFLAVTHHTGVAAVLFTFISFSKIPFSATRNKHFVDW